MRAKGSTKTLTKTMGEEVRGIPASIGSANCASAGGLVSLSREGDGLRIMAKRTLTSAEIALCRRCDEWNAANPLLADRLSRLRVKLPHDRINAGRGRWFLTGFALGCLPALLAVFGELPWKLAVMVPGWAGAGAGLLAVGAWMGSAANPWNPKRIREFAISEAARADALAGKWSREDVEQIDALVKLEAGLIRPERLVSVEVLHLFALAGFLKLRR
jgi:hypothetical protein